MPGSDDDDAMPFINFEKTADSDDEEPRDGATAGRNTSYFPDLYSQSPAVHLSRQGQTERHKNDVGAAYLRVHCDMVQAPSQRASLRFHV